MPRRPQTFGEYLQAKAKAKGTTVPELTKKLKFSQHGLDGASKGSNPGIRMDTLVKLGNELDFDYNDAVSYFGGHGPRDEARIVSDIAHRPTLRRLYTVAREMSEAQMRQLIGHARAILEPDSEAVI